MLVRRHPLTVEGEDLGVIDVAFACGSNAGEYLIHYTELRRGADIAAAPLKSVELRLANHIVPLKLEAPRAARGRGDVLASASGIVTGAMLQNFASRRMRSMVIETTADNSEGAVIRIGNSGAAASLIPFQASCTQQSARAEHALLQTEAR
jgi:hypothetical protein